MRADDPLPVDPALLRPFMFVGDVVTVPERTPLLEAAASIGCGTARGVDMYRANQALMMDFLLGAAQQG